MQRTRWQGIPNRCRSWCGGARCPKMMGMKKPPMAANVSIRPVAVPMNWCSMWETREGTANQAAKPTMRKKPMAIPSDQSAGSGTTGMRIRNADLRRACARGRPGPRGREPASTAPGHLNGQQLAHPEVSVVPDAPSPSLTTRTDHTAAESCLEEVATPTLVVMGEQAPDFPDPRAQAEWMSHAVHASVVMVPDVGHYPQSRQPEITTSALLSFLGKVSHRG